MSDEQTKTITVQDVLVKEGAKDGRAWKKWAVKDGNGDLFSTFSETVGSVGEGLVGKRAVITFKVSGDRGQFNDLLTLEPEADPAIPPVRTEDGSADWDVIGLRKTRCALWVAFIEAHGAVRTSGSRNTDEFLATGRKVVKAAEWDIFHREPVDKDADDPIPF